MQPNVNESLVDAWIERVVQNHKGSDTSLKYACISAAQVVGSYSGATGVIASQTKRSVSTIENWAHAFRLYKQLRVASGRLGGFYLVRKLWRTLPASHWWLAYDIQQAGFDALYYLDNADAHQWSARDMLKEYKQDREGGSAPLVFRHACVSFYGLAGELLKRHKELTPEQLKAVQAVKKAFDGAIIRAGGKEQLI